MNYAYDWDFFSIFPMLKCPTFRCKIFPRDQNALVLKINTSRVASIHLIFPHSPNLRCGGNHILLPFYCTYFGHFVLPSKVAREFTDYLYMLYILFQYVHFFLVSSVSTLFVPKISAVYFCLQLSVSMFFLFSWRLPLCWHVLFMEYFNVCR